MTAEIAPYITVFAAVIAAAVAYAFNMRLERRKSWHLQERTKAYASYIESIAAVGGVQDTMRRIMRRIEADKDDDTTELLRELSAARARLWQSEEEMTAAMVRNIVYASPDVIARMVDFWSGRTTLDNDDSIARFIAIAKVMRSETVGLAGVDDRTFEVLLFGGGKSR